MTCPPLTTPTPTNQKIIQKKQLTSTKRLKNMANNVSLNLPLDDLPLDDDGHLLNHHQWTPQVAQQLADTLDITLTDVHHVILATVRQFYATYHHPPATRALIKYLQQQLPQQGISNQFLQQLFNTGLVARHVNRIAGLPKPPNCL